MAFCQSNIGGQAPIICSLCENVKAVIKWKCLDCGLFMCNDCKKRKHSKIRNSSDHKIVDISEVGHHTEELDFTTIKCQEHSGQSSCLFCLSCDKLVCPSCFAKVHKTHDLIEIREAYNSKIEKLKKGHSKLRNENVEIVETEEQLKQLEILENSKHAKITEEIQVHGKALKQEVDKYTEQLKNELDKTHVAFSQAAEGNLSTISTSKKAIDEKYSEVEDFINTTNITEFFQEVSMIERLITEQLQKPKVPCSTRPNFISGEITKANVGVLKYSESLSVEPRVSMIIINEYKTELSRVDEICSFPDSSLWIRCTTDNSLQKVVPEGTYIRKVANFNIKVYGMAVNASNDLILAIKGSRLKLIHSNNGELKDSIYNLEPFEPTAIHITEDKKVIIGCSFLKLKRYSLKVMDENGDNETVYEHDQHDQPLFSYPKKITSTSNGNIHVVDSKKDAESGRVVILTKTGDEIYKYTGLTSINNEIPFKPTSIVTTPRDNVIVAVAHCKTLHIINMVGQLLTYYDITEIAIPCAHSFVFSPSEKLYIGCSKQNQSTHKTASLYEVDLKGC